MLKSGLSEKKVSRFLKFSSRKSNSAKHQFLIDKIVQNTNFVKITECQMFIFLYYCKFYRSRIKVLQNCWGIFCVSENTHCVTCSLLWQCGLWSFQPGGTKLERFLRKNQHTQRKLLNFENWVNGEVSKIGHHFSK